MVLPRIVYAIKHNPTGKYYVGSTGSPRSRIMQHFNTLRAGTHANKQMQADFDEFGDDYSLFILDVVIEHPERIKEYFWIDVLNSRDPEHGYNQFDQSNAHDIREINEYHLENSTMEDKTYNAFSEEAAKILDRYKE